MRPVEVELTVVIPTLGRDILRRSLAALEAGTAWPGEVIVVDQGRSPAVRDLTEEAQGRGLRVRWAPSHERGRAVGVNRGIALVSTQFVAVTDDDCLADPRWVEALAARLRRHPGAIITGRVDGEEGVAMTVTAEKEHIQRRPSLRFDRLSGGNMAAATDLVTRLGGLDEDRCLSTAEDGEFAYRALRARVPIVYAPEAAVCHLDWRGKAERIRQYEGYARSQGGFYGKYLRRGDAFIALRASAHFLRSLRRWVLGSVRGQTEAALIGRAYALGLAPGIIAGWRTAGRR